MLLLRSFVKFLIIYIDSPLPIFLRDKHERRNPLTIKDGVNESCIQQLLKFFFDNVLKGWIHSPLRLPKWFTILFNVDVMGTN